MILHLNKELFKDAVSITANQLNIPPEFVEKDYWVTFSLHQIFNNEIGNDAIFKGGTALSKCYNLIDRFSEDIDLVVIRREGESDSKLKSKIKSISDLVASILPEENIEGLTQKMGMNRKTAHCYERIFEENYNQVRSIIVLESTWLGYHEPYSKKHIVSYVGNMMIENNQTEIASENGLLPFELLALDPTRTICEKIMSLVRFSYGKDPITNLKNKVRHTYDLHKLLAQPFYVEFLQSGRFDEMLLKVAKDDIASFKNNNEWLSNHPGDSLMFKDVEAIWKELATVYSSDFKPLVYKNFPHETEILASLLIIQERLKTIDWSIVIS
jgi:hypothetical protein